MNPKGQALKRWMVQLLDDRYPKHDQLIERLGAALATNQEVQDFGALAVDLFEIGYLRCMNDYRKKLDAMGVKVSIVPESRS